MDLKFTSTITGSVSDILEQAWKEIALLQDDTPIYFISGSGYDWFYNPNVSSMVRIPRGVEIFPLLEGDDNEDLGSKIPCMYEGNIVMISKDEITTLGWN